MRVNGEHNGLSGHPQDQRGEITHWKRDIGINKINEEGKIQGICRGSDKTDKPTTARKTQEKLTQWPAGSNVQYISKSSLVNFYFAT